MEKEVLVGTYVRNGTIVKQHTRKLTKTEAAVGGAVVGGVGFAALGDFGKLVNHKMDRGPNFDNFSELASKLKPGDILVTGDRKYTPAAFLIGTGTGNMKTYHTEVVNRILPNGDVETLELTDGGYHTSRFNRDGTKFFPDHIKPNVVAASGSMRNISAVRVPDEALVRKSLENFRYKRQVVDTLRAELLSRGVKPEQVHKVMASVFDVPSLVTVGFQEVLSPLIKVPNKKIAEEQIRANRLAFELLDKNMNSYARDIINALNSGKNPAKVLPANIRSMCSSAVATAGFPVWDKRSPKYTVPLDALRSNSLEVIGHFSAEAGAAPSRKFVVPIVENSRYLVRGGIGATVGALGALGAYKLMTSDGEQVEKTAKLLEVATDNSSSDYVKNKEKKAVIVDAAYRSLRASVSPKIGRMLDEVVQNLSKTDSEVFMQYAVGITSGMSASAASKTLAKYLKDDK